MIIAKSEPESARDMDDCFITDDTKDDVYIDLDSFWRDMGGIPPHSQEGSLDDLSFSDIPEGLQEVLSPGTEVPRSNALSPSYNSEVSDSRTGCSEGFSESAGNSIGRDEKSEPALQLSFAEDGHFRNVTGYVPDQGNIHHFLQTGTSDFRHPNHVNDPCKYSRADTSFNRDKTFHDASCTASRSYDVNGAEVQDHLSGSSGQYMLSSYDLPFSPDSPVFGLDSYWMDEVMDDRKNLNENFNAIPYKNLAGDLNANCDNGSSISLDRVVDMHAMRIQPKEHSNTLSNVFDKVHNHIGSNEKIESITSNDIVSRAFGVIDNVMNRKFHPGSGKLTVPEGITWSSSNPSSLISHENYICQPNDVEEDVHDPNKSLLSLGVINQTPIRTSRYYDKPSVRGLSRQPGILPSPYIKPELNFMKIKNEVPKFNSLRVSHIGYQGISSSTFEQSSADEDPDVQILEDISQPARQRSSMMSSKFVSESHISSLRALDNQMITGNSISRSIPNDERIIYRVALQDLSQPKSESTPPEGLLVYPLLKHQRIALYWMVNKETKGGCCSGGILADDQGLGKTISTISLILTERSPSSKAIKVEEQIKTETLNLDEDDEASETDHVMEIIEPYANNSRIDICNVPLQAMGRPAAGTLVVCPTSVLRQWSDELHSKVTSKANLSVLVYHGSNRTKDPLELAKYDVVVTTYAIVSMEVPKQPNVDELDDGVGKSFRGQSSSKKRKLGSVSDKKSSGKKKHKNGDNELIENISGPLAKVGWFRVVLDEAQSIKNHRTQVARACWGLRAKRRWCLSGTPIQNSIDDLYSYFRFLRLEPYAVFKTFVEQIKVPINRNPKNGFKKLQAVLKTIMLRRTKGTLLDGEPIINLPPKTVELKQVDFSEEELDFYRTLEADSRAQFAEYAAKGTLEQNYVNILLMLLRLRQACDHPLLVKQSNTNSKINSSIAMAKKLPRDTQLSLLNCLEASLAICGICNDPPEDSVVTVCGHVFCNQCICEHMLGDDPQCPAKNCKMRLNMSDVFSITSLRCALSDNLNPQTQCYGHELAKASEPHSSSYPQGSSKIKACLEILLSLAKPLDCASTTSSSGFIKADYLSEKLEPCDLAGEKATTNENINPNSVVKLAGEKAIVFSQWTKMLDLLEACLKNTSIQYRRLDGTMPVTARDRAVKDFNTLPQVTVMIMSLKAASLGLNMVAACRVVLLDLWWNPTTEDQAIDRAHRIGQTRPVSVFRLTVKDTVEDRILALQQRKRQMVASAFGEDETGSRQTRLTVDDLKYLFKVD